MDLIFEIFFEKIFIIEREIDKIFRFARLFPIGHIAWNRYRNHPMAIFFRLFDEDRGYLTDVNSEEDESDTLMERKREHEGEETPSSPAAKRAREDDEFENALEYITDND